MAPEYIGHGKLTEKVDVYSYGVLLLEVVTGMPNRGMQTSEYTHSLVSIVSITFTTNISSLHFSTLEKTLNTKYLTHQSC